MKPLTSSKRGAGSPRSCGIRASISPAGSVENLKPTRRSRRLDHRRFRSASPLPRCVGGHRRDAPAQQRAAQPVGRPLRPAGLATGDRVLHVGAGLGYYSAILAEIVGRSGEVTAIEIDAGLAEGARANLARAWPQASVVAGDDSLGPGHRPASSPGTASASEPMSRSTRSSSTPASRILRSLGSIR
jgi:SAM-dependent methyltransferase